MIKYRIGRCLLKNHDELSLYEVKDNHGEFFANAIRKTKRSFVELLVLGILAGFFIAMGSFFSQTTINGVEVVGLRKIISSVSFCLGLILVIFTGSELFTGNILMLIAMLKGYIKLSDLLRNWIIIYAANFIGASIAVVLIFFSMVWNNTETVKIAVDIVNDKIHYSFSAAFILGVLCNILVCSAVWICSLEKSESARIMIIIFCIGGFVAMGFEHCVANMFTLSYGKLIADYTGVSSISWADIFAGNLLPVTLGNLTGGILLSLPLYVKVKS